ncbi:hypothetical protein ANN_17625 [Periplaneta americana]|uniref:DUF4780 domain-containing protein n=1 Tax=Periplaneta americana TaxID=6978 RepID=A0ABQ8SUP3_PERAM|nr:hypothetical protein ANN_17625 [Periplaneta americana]
MAGLCKGDNEPPGSLKAICNYQGQLEGNCKELGPRRKELGALLNQVTLFNLAVVEAKLGQGLLKELGAVQTHHLWQRLNLQGWETAVVEAKDLPKPFKVAFRTQDLTTSDPKVLLKCIQLVNQQLCIEHWKEVHRQTGQCLIMMIDQESASKIKNKRLTAFTGMDRGLFKTLFNTGKKAAQEKQEAAAEEKEDSPEFMDVGISGRFHLKRLSKHRKLPSICSYWVEGKPRKKPQPGNLPQPEFEPGPPGFAARRADRYSTALERLVDRHIRDKILKDFPLHKYQFAYLPGKFTEAPLHHVVSANEKVLAFKEIAMEHLTELHASGIKSPSRA